MFLWQKQYLTSELSARVRYCFCHLNIKFISSPSSIDKRLVNYNLVFFFSDPGVRDSEVNATAKIRNVRYKKELANMSTDDSRNLTSRFKRGVRH